MKPQKTAKQPQIDALIFDLDGVVTQTRKLHKKAWGKLFDEFFENNPGITEAQYSEKMSDSDYSDYIDGKPRYEGVKSFLSARNANITEGSIDDSPGTLTIYGLGNRKNQLFQAFLKKEGAEVYDDAVRKIRHWRQHGIKTAIVSSSKNCRLILEQTGLHDLFDVRVDGLVAEERSLKGKPDPDIFLEAAKELRARPEKSVVFEDAVSGVKAGQAGFFGLVVGVSRFDNASALKDNGADICIDDFDDFEVLDNEEVYRFFKASRPMVFSEESDVFDRLKNMEPAFFLDYDGTLTPIVQRPEDAVISDSMRKTLSKLAERFTVAVVTGRDLHDVKQFIRLNNIIYSGSHGYITSGPNGLHMEHDDSEKIITVLDKIEKELHEALDDSTEGVQIDRKRYAIAVHYRNAREKDISTVNDAVDQMLKRHPEHIRGEGKMVVEIKPDIDWHKGKAVLWIMEALEIHENKNVIPVFIGDDVTDEDAFKAIKGKGIGILVENHGQPTAADYSLKNVYQVERFFDTIINR